MTIMSSIKRIVSANINKMIEKAEDPETMLKQMIREMDDSIITMRNEIVKAIASEKWLGRQIESAGRTVDTWQENCEKAVRDGDDGLAREAIGRKLKEEQKLAELVESRKRAALDSDALKTQLHQLEDKVQEARRKKDLLVARKRRALSQRSMMNAARGAADIAKKSEEILAESDFSAAESAASFADEITRLEVEAEAIREVAQRQPSLEERFEKSRREEEVERQLQEMKRKAGK